MPQIAPEPAQEIAPSFIPSSEVQDASPEFIPEEKGQDAQPEPSFIPADAVQSAEPEGFVPEEAVSKPQPESEYLAGLTRKQLAEHAFQDLQNGVQDISKYRAAYRARVESGDLLDSNKNGTGDSEGTFSSALHLVTGAAAAMYNGTKDLAHEAGRATGIDWAKTKFTGPDSAMVTLPDAEAQQGFENVVAGSKLAAFRAADMIRTFTERLANRMMGRPLGALSPAMDSHTTGSLLQHAADQQFDNDVASQMVQEGVRTGAQMSGKTFETDPKKVESISNSPLVDPSMWIPGGEAFAGARGAKGLAARTLSGEAAVSIDKSVLSAAGKAAAVPVQAAADVARFASKTLDGSPLLSGLAAGGVAFVAGGSTDTEILAALLGANSKSAGLINRVGGSIASTLDTSAKRLAGALPPGPIGKFATRVYDAVAPEARGFLAGQLANTPFLLGAGDEDNFKAVLAGGLVAHSAGRLGGRVVSGLDIGKNLWKANDTAPEIRMPVKDYGEDAHLDEAHRKVVDSLGNTSNNFVQSIRDYFGKEGGEVYAMGPDDYAATIDKFVAAGDVSPEDGAQAKQQIGVTFPGIRGEDGKPRTVALSLVTPAIPGLSVGHEVGHMLERLLSDEELAFVRQETQKYYGTDEVEAYRNAYNALVDRTDSATPKIGETNKDGVLSEIFAEHVSAVLNAIPITRFSDTPGKRSYGRTVYSMVARGLEKIGVRRPMLVEGSGTLTGTGIEPSARLGHLVENVLQAHRLDRQVVGVIGDLGAPPKPEVSGSKTPSAAPANPEVSGSSNEIANARPVTPKEQPPGFKKGDPIGEIRNSDGVLIGEDAKVTKPAQDGQVEVEFTHPDTGERLVGTVSEELLQSPVSPGKPNPNVVATHPHPITDATPPYVAKTAEDIVAPKQGELPVPQQKENTVRPQRENVRTTPAAQDAFATKATPEVAAQNLSTVRAAVAKPRADIPAFETDYYSAKSDVGHPDAVVRAEQRRLADQAEQQGKPNPLRKIYQKIFVPYKLVEGSNNRPRVFGFSLDKLIQNSEILKGWLSEKGQDTSYLSSDKFREDLQGYLENQSHGYGGAGQKLVIPADARPGITARDGEYTPKVLSPEAAQTINLLMGFELPGKRTPAQDFHERFARLNGLDPLTLASGVADVNPLRVRLRQEGFDLRLLNGAVENLPIENFTTPLKERGDLKFTAGDTAFSQAGFMPRPQGNESTRAVAEDYAKQAGLKNFEPHSRYAPIDESRAKKIADFYNEAKHNPEAPEVQKAYTALADETMQQYRAMQDAGIAIEPWEGKGEPYHNSRAMMDDVRDNKHLWFFKTDNGFGESTESKGNALLEDSGVTINGQKLLKNDIFRAVHDYFGHTAEGYEFGPRGEYNAYLAHSRMFSEEARPALAAETLAQNSWVNFGPHLRREDGALPKVGDADFVPIAQRKFADQKNTIVPESLLNEVDTASRAAYMPAPPTGWVLPDGSYEGNTNPMNIGDWHAGHLGLNADKYKKKFGYSAPKAGDERLAALSKGFVRVRYDGKTGRMGVEADAKMFTGKVRAKVEDVIEDNIHRIDRLDVNLFDSKGKLVRQSGDSIFRLKDFEKSQAAIDILRGKAVREVSYMPKPITDAVSPEEVTKGSYWLSPSGKFHPLDDFGTHENWALQSQGMEFSDTGSPGSSSLYKKGWLRVTGAHEQGRIVANTEPGLSLSPKQESALRDVAQTIGAESAQFESGSSRLKTVYNQNEPAYMPAPKTDTPEFRKLSKEFIGRDDTFWGIEEDKALGGAAFKSGHAAVECTGFACAIHEKLGKRAEVFGFSEEDNPNSHIAQSAGGHDFAVVDKRYIVDPWVTDVEGMPEKGVLDLQNPRDAASIERLYGDQSKWRPAKISEGKISFMPAPKGVLADFKADTVEKALKKPGWAILTATQEALGNAQDPRNVAANVKLGQELAAQQIPFERVSGSYLGQDQGTNYLIKAPESEALKLAKVYGQESVLTHRGYLYQDGSVAPTVHKNTVVGDAAKEQPGYSVLPDGTAFSAGVNWDTRFKPAEDRFATLAEAADGGMRASTRVPTAKKATENALTSDLAIGSDHVLRDYDTKREIAAAIKRYPNTPAKLTKAGEIIDSFQKQVVDNLLWLHDKFPEKLRDRAKLWYDGGRKLVEAAATKHEITHAQAAAVYASLSPQKDWFMNVDLARRVFETRAEIQDKTLPAEVAAWYASKFGEKVPKTADYVNGAVGEKYDSLPIELKAIWLRAADELLGQRSYQIVTPEGNFSGPAKNLDGTPSKVAWGSFGPIEKSISVLEDGSKENISRQLGAEHKVRNFYNNLLLPSNKDHGDVTIDTHAVAAGLIRPLAGSDVEVEQNLGSGVPSSAFTGASGSYGLYADAYRQAAKERGLLPREMQSITWEAVRGLFPSEFKTVANKAKVDSLWKEYKNGNKSIEQVRAEIFDLAGGIRTPSWAVRNAGSDVQSGGGADAGKVHSAELGR